MNNYNVSFKEASQFVLDDMTTIDEKASTDEGLLYLDRIRDTYPEVDRYLNEPSIARELEILLDV